MINSIEDYEQDLFELLSSAKENGVITNEEYREFLKDTKLTEIEKFSKEKKKVGTRI